MRATHWWWWSTTQRSCSPLTASSTWGPAPAARAVDPGATKTEISTQAREFAQAKSVAGSAPDVREQKVAELKARIAAGNYEVNAQAIADRMVDEHITSGIG